MEGYLQKWTNYILGWKKRYFVIKGNQLHYFKQKGDKVKGKIHLAITVFNVKGSNQIILNTGIKNLNLKAENSIDRDNWFNAMRVAKFEGQKEKISLELNSDKGSVSKSSVNLNIEVLSNKLNELKTNFENINRDYSNNVDDLLKSHSKNIPKESFSLIYEKNKVKYV